MRKKFVRGLISVIVSLVAKVEVVGLEKIPKDGSCIIASNHLGRLDAFLVYSLLSRDDIILTIAEKYQKVALFRWAARNLDGIWIDRFNADFGALREVIKRLRRGGIYVVAPEGTRSKTEALISGKPGASYLAAKLNVPIIPVAITGSEDRLVASALKKFRRSIVFVRIGEKFLLNPLPHDNRDETLQIYTDEIMCQIAALLPLSYRGVYADHPRLKEILSA